MKRVIEQQDLPADVLQKGAEWQRKRSGFDPGSMRQSFTRYFERSNVFQNPNGI